MFPFPLREQIGQSVLLIRFVPFADADTGNKRPSLAGVSCLSLDRWLPVVASVGQLASHWGMV